MIRIPSSSKKKAQSEMFVIDSNIRVEQKPSTTALNWGNRIASHVNELGKKLLTSAAEGNPNEIRRLLNEGAPFIADWLGTTPLHLAAQWNHPEVCDILIRSGISTNARTKVDRTPLHISAYEGHLNVVDVLLRANADIDAIDILKMTPLHWAVQNGHSDIVELLIKSGADKTLENNFGLKAIDIATQIHRLDIIEIFEERFQDENSIIATENLAIEMIEGMKDEEENACLEEKNEQMAARLENHEENNSVSRILKEHGITMLPEDDDNNILSSVMESGHSVVLTDIGRQMLNSVKASEENFDRNLKKKNFITVSAEDFLNLASNKTQIVRRINGKPVPKTIKKIVINNNKVQSSSNIIKQKNQSHEQMRLKEIEIVKKKLEDAEKLAEEYREKLNQKEIEIEKFKQQLSLLTER